MINKEIPRVYFRTIVPREKIDISLQIDSSMMNLRATNGINAAN
jgi:hypothetical protein